MTTPTTTIEDFANKEYQWGFVTDLEMETIPKGLNEDVVRLISAKKNEPAFMLDWRLKAFRHWLKLREPRWAHVDGQQAFGLANQYDMYLQHGHSIKAANNRLW